MEDYAAMAISAGARGVMIHSAADRDRRCAKRWRPDLPTFIQASMEDAPTPTPGHWQIHDIFRKGE
jgi:acetolactate synthase-1/2/3 large subunit